MSEGKLAWVHSQNVTVTLLQPGATATDFFHRADMEHTKVGSEGKFENDPAKVVKQGFEALLAGKDHVFSESMKTKLQGAMSKVAPPSVRPKCIASRRNRRRRAPR